mgnify:CR=1 FL=1
MMTSATAADNTNSTPPTIAVIGGGPAAMFYCHALETQKKELIAKGEDVSGFPTTVRCFERSFGAGGVWRSDRAHGAETGTFGAGIGAETIVEEKKEEEMFEKGYTDGLASSGDVTPNMYSALWTNGPKECFEFADYTFVDH